MLCFNLTAKEGTDFFYIQLKSTLYLSLCVVFNRFSDNAKKDLLLSIMREPLHRSMRLTLFIGVVLDKNLTWKSHISSIAEKTSEFIGIIFRSSFYLSISSLRMLYNSMILTYLNYYNLVWRSTFKSNLHRQRIIILRQCVTRVVDKSYYNALTEAGAHYPEPSYE